MNIRDFEYIIAIDELGNFSKAAKKCFISQPALSQQIRKIEDQLNFIIFERDKRGIITTKKGQEFIEYAKRILGYYKKIQGIAHEESSLKIALIPTICPYLLPLIVKDLNKKFSHTKFYFLEAKTEDVLKKLANGEIDCGIIAYFSHLIDDRLSYYKLYDEEFLLALHKKSTLNESDFPDILQQNKLILLEEGNCMSDNIQDICSIYQQVSFSDFYATNIETVKNMIKINNGAALLPKLSCLDEENLKLISFKDKKTREIGIVTRNSYMQKSVIIDIQKTISHTVEKIL